MKKSPLISRRVGRAARPLQFIAVMAVLVVLRAAAPALSAAPYTTAGARVFLANGMKIGEVTDTSAIVWTRVTRHPERNVNGFPFLRIAGEPSETAQLAGHTLDEMEGAVPGAQGEVRLHYRPGSAARERTTPWTPVAAAKDCTVQFPLAGLTPGTRYSVTIEARPTGAAGEITTLSGTFATAPVAATPATVLFTVVTGQDYARRDDPANGHKTYAHMRALHPDFFVHTGDEEYYDKPTPLATTVPLARFKWNRIYALPYERAFHNEVASYFMRDDHDTLKDDCWPGQRYGQLTWADGLALEREQLPMAVNPPYRHVRWGRDLEVWFVEGREYRSPNDAPDGPDKTIWGHAQKQWFFDTVRASDATFRILVAPTPIVGPDRATKGDNHSNVAFAHEGRELRQFISQQKNMVVICGDRHWQYVSVDPETQLREYSSGPTSDAHAAGFSEADRTPMHRYLKIKGGFLAVTIERIDDQPRAIFRHYGVDGQIYNEDVVLAK